MFEPNGEVMIIKNLISRGKITIPGSHTTKMYRWYSNNNLNLKNSEYLSQVFLIIEIIHEASTGKAPHSRISLSFSNLLRHSSSGNGDRQKKNSFISSFNSRIFIYFFHSPPMVLSPFFLILYSLISEPEPRSACLPLFPSFSCLQGPGNLQIYPEIREMSQT